MRCRTLWLLLLGALPLHAAEPYKSATGPSEVKVLDFDWTDAARDGRHVPARLYYPATGDTPSPLIVFSHGLGGTCRHYELHGRHWASYGYAVLHIQHVGSDDSVWQGLPPAEIMPAMRKAALDPRNALNRPKDVTFALDEATRLNAADGPLKGRLDLQHIGLAGHSFGGFTTLASSGEQFILPGGRKLSFADPRITAAIAMSAPVPRNKANLAQALAPIKIPMLHLTGTKDDSPIGDTNAADRRLIYEQIKAEHQYLVVFKDGDHMVFSGRVPGLAGAGVRGTAGDPALDERIHDWLHQVCMAFWDAWLRGDAGGRKWLDEGLAGVLGAGGTVERK